MPRATIRFAARLIAVWVVLISIALLAPKPIISLFTPAIAPVVDMIQGDYLTRLVLQDAEHDTELRMMGTTVRPITLAPGAVIPPGRNVTGAVHGTHVLVPVIICFGLILAWPAGGGVARGISLILGVFGTALVQAATVPFMLVGVVDIQIYNASIDAGAAVPVESPRLVWMLFVENGGRWAMAAGAAFAAILGTRGILSLLQRPRLSASGEPGGPRSTRRAAARTTRSGRRRVHGA